MTSLAKIESLLAVAMAVLIAIRRRVDGLFSLLLMSPLYLKSRHCFRQCQILSEVVLLVLSQFVSFLPGPHSYKEYLPSDRKLILKGPVSKPCLYFKFVIKGSSIFKPFDPRFQTRK